MRYYWVRERVQSGEFDVTWLAGSKHIADFFTKPLPAAKHKEIQALLMALITEPVIAAPNGPPQRQHVTSQPFNIFDVFYDEDDDDEEYIRSNTVFSCITTHSNNIAVSSMHGLYNLITNHTQYTEVCLAYPFIVPTRARLKIYFVLSEVVAIDARNSRLSLLYQDQVLPGISSSPELIYW
jgi:hypothetical protein